MPSAFGVSARRLNTVAMVVLLSLFAFASIATHDASAKNKKAKKAKVSLSITTKNQAALLKAKKLTVKVKSTAKATVSLSAGKNFKTTKAKFKKNKKQTKTVKLALTSAGKKALATCGAKTVSVKGKYKKGKKKATAKAKKKLAKDSTKCNVTPPIDYTTVPLGDDPEHCDFMDTTVCLQPWPNDFYTKDASTPTGKQLNLGENSTPMNSGNPNPTHMSVEDINRADGFSPGSAILLKVPGLDTPAAFNNSNLVPLNDISKYKDANASVVLIDAATGERQPIWAELDANPTTVDPTYGPDPDGNGPLDPPLLNAGGINLNPTNTGPVNLMVQEAKNLQAGHRYIVAFRNLKDASNQAIDAPVGFKVYRDNLPTQQAVVENRRAHMDSVLSDLSTKAGISKDGLYMAWDFTVASERSSTGRMTDIRDDAFSKLGDTNLANRKIEGNSPTYVIDAWCDKGETSADGTGPFAADNKCEGSGGTGTLAPVPNGTSTQRTVLGHLTNVPCYLNQNGCPSGAEFAFNPDGSVKLDAGFTTNVPFRCIIPKSIVSSGTVVPGGTGTYGHGLLGSLNQINATEAISNATNSTYCAMNFDGFSTFDLGLILQSLSNLSNFHKAVDRMQQGFVNFLMVQRALVHPDGLHDSSAFNMTFNGTTPLVTPASAIDISQGADTRGVYYGISQGGIMGGAVTALSPDADKGILGVPAINYSTLLRRSVDSDEYFKAPGIGLYQNYPDLASRPLLLSLMQQLWDRGEGNGYANNMTDNPLENTPPHTVLLQPAIGDHQVSNFAMEVEARTIGAKRFAPTTIAGRSWDDDYEALPPVSATAPAGNSYMVYYDGGPVGYTNGSKQGSKIAPLESVPPRPEWGYGGDPHGYPRSAPDAIEHEKTFVANGTLGPCVSGALAGGVCVANNWDGAAGLP